MCMYQIKTKQKKIMKFTLSQVESVKIGQGHYSPKALANLSLAQLKDLLPLVVPKGSRRAALAWKKTFSKTSWLSMLLRRNFKSLPPVKSWLAPSYWNDGPVRPCGDCRPNHSRPKPTGNGWRQSPLGSCQAFLPRWSAGRLPQVLSRGAKESLVTASDRIF